MANSASKHPSDCKRLPRLPHAFTLVELLVVIGIIALLVGILLPAMNRIRQRGQQTKCAAQLRQIGYGVQLYVNAYNGVLNFSHIGTRWLSSGVLSGLADSQESTPGYPYWGVAYAPFIFPSSTVKLTGPQSAEIVRLAYGIWHCPSSLVADPTTSNQPEDPISYGINGMITGSRTPRWRKVARYKNTSEIIFAQDAIRPYLSSFEEDTLSSFDESSNLTYWRNGGDGYQLTTAGVREYYRHLHVSNILWLDGHVSGINESLGTDVPSVWYLPSY